MCYGECMRRRFPIDRPRLIQAVGLVLPPCAVCLCAGFVFAYGGSLDGALWVVASVVWICFTASRVQRRLITTNESGEWTTALDWAAWKAEGGIVVQDAYTYVEVEHLVRAAAVTAYSDALMFGDNQPFFQGKVGDVIHLPTGAIVDLRTADALTAALIKIVSAEHEPYGNEVNWTEVLSMWEDHVWPAFTDRERSALMCAGIVAAGQAIGDDDE